MSDMQEFKDRAAQSINMMITDMYFKQNRIILYPLRVGEGTRFRAISYCYSKTF